MQRRRRCETAEYRQASERGGVSRQNRYCQFAALGAMLLLTACGGGGNDGASAVSPPSNSTTQPTSTPSTPVVIFANPSPQTFALVGSSTTSAGDGYTPVAPDARLTNLSLEAVNQPRLRYGASSGYELQLPGGEFDLLVHYIGLLNPTSENNFFQPSAARQNAATFIISRSSLDGYVYSELASWSSETSSIKSGLVAFGFPTPSTTIANSGSAGFRGQIFGIVDITYFDGLYGGNYFSTVGGTVTLTVDFATRAIEGTLEIDDPKGTSSISVPLTATTFLPVDNDFWGSFETSQSGFNEFRVKLTGPDASELIGSWAVPILIDGNPHQLMGVWIAARG
jgi:hypothetical protein